MDKTYLIAYYRVRAKMDAWESHINAQELKRRTANSNNG